MGIFKSKAEKELDDIIVRLQMNLSNNYKDNAQDNLKDFENAYERMKSNGTLKGNSLTKYGAKLEEYREKLKGYAHKDQKPYWT